MKYGKKTNVKFKDNDNILYNVEIEIKHLNGYPEFSMSGEGNGSSGQNNDRIKPKNPQQKRLLELWDKYHLNGMNAGTPKQTRLIEQMEQETTYSYEKACDYLNSFDRDENPITAFDLQEIESEREALEGQIRDVENEIESLEECKEYYKGKFMLGGGWILWKDLGIKYPYNNQSGFNNLFKHERKKREVKLEKLKSELEQAQAKTLLYDYGTDGNLYQYGSTWHKVDLPTNLWEEVEQLVRDITKIEELSKAKGGDWEELHNYKLVALGKYLELEPNEAEEDITEEQDGVFSYCGTDYYVLTEEEAYDRAEDYLGDELWQMAVEGGHTELGKKEWIEHVIETDGYGTTLNSYDGTEYYDDDNKVYIMRC